MIIALRRPRPPPPAGRGGGDRGRPHPPRRAPVRRRRWTRRSTRRTASSPRGSSRPMPTSAGRRSTGRSSRTAATRSSGTRASSRCCRCAATAQDEEAGRACVDFSMAELLRGGVTTVMEIGTLGEYVVERAAHYGLRVYMGQAFRSGRWLTRDGKRVEWEWNEEQGRQGLAPRRSSSTSSYDGAHGDLVRCFFSPAQIDTCTPELLARRQALRRRGQAARTRCTPRSPSSSSTRWSPATARRPSPGCRSWACSDPTPSWATPSSSAARRGPTTRRATCKLMAGRRRVGGPRGVGLRPPRRRHGVLRALPRGRRQHVARHRHQSPERDRGDALGGGGARR